MKVEIFKQKKYAKCLTHKCTQYVLAKKTPQPTDYIISKKALIYLLTNFLQLE